MNSKGAVAYEFDVSKETLLHVKISLESCDKSNVAQKSRTQLHCYVVDFRMITLYTSGGRCSLQVRLCFCKVLLYL